MKDYPNEYPITQIRNTENGNHQQNMWSPKIMMKRQIHVPIHISAHQRYSITLLIIVHICQPKVTMYCTSCNIKFVRNCIRGLNITFSILKMSIQQLAFSLINLG